MSLPVADFKIADIMHRHVVVADVATSARECARRIALQHVGCLIVIENDRPVGIITERSFVHLVKQGAIDPDAVTARDFMSSPLITITPHADFARAMQMFSKKGVKRLPVVKNHHVVGLLTLKNMVEFSNIALVNLDKKNRRLTTQASLDALTGLSNKAAITDAISKEFERLKRYGGRSSILFVDIDHFKAINDRYSHIAGDAVLQELGRVLKKECRSIDMVGRFGGEEFVIIAPNRKKYHAVQFGNRLRTAIENHLFPYKDLTIRFTVSIGIASLFEGRDYTVALERADKALYHAKHMGRNRIGLWRDGKLSIAKEVEIDGSAADVAALSL